MMIIKGFCYSKNIIHRTIKYVNKKIRADANILCTFAL